jgi:hypothetical protein
MVWNRFQVFYAFNKSEPFADHDHVDGVKIAFAAKTSAQVGFRIGGGLKFMTDRTKKSKISFTEL